MDSGKDTNEEKGAQTQLLKQFRKNLSDILAPDVSDKVLLKWLRAKNFNLAKCEEMYRVNYRTRCVFQLDQIEDIWDIPEVLQNYMFSNQLGFAKDGTPIYYMAMGRGDLKGLTMSLDAFSVGKYCSLVLEKEQKRCKEQSIKLGKEIDQITYIVDMEYFSVRQVWFSGVLEITYDLFRLLQEHHPEIWNNVFIVNAPLYFQGVFNFFKPVFGKNLLQKMYVVSKSGTANLLLQYVDPEVLPAFLGGKRVDSSGDPMCSEFMKFGGIIPEKYYLRNRPLLQPTDKGVEDVCLSPKCCHNCIAVIREANSILCLELRTEGGSISTVLLYRKFGSDPENLDLPGTNENLDPADKKCNVQQCGPRGTFQTHISPLDNYCLAPWPGIYIFKLDNTYNWLTSRRCIYRLRVLPPGAVQQKKLNSELNLDAKNITENL